MLLPVTEEADAAANGIFDGGFETYRTVTQEDYRSLLTSGLVVLDTNTLLNLYRYHEKTRQDLIEIFTRIRDRLWVPHQVMFEFWQGRPSVISSRSREIENIITSLLNSSSDLERAIRTWSNRIGLHHVKTAEIVNTIESAVSAVIEKIHELSADSAFELAEDTARDPIISMLSSILNGRVGHPLSAEELQNARKEAMRRFADHRPPGWKDRKKDNPEGNYVIWVQTLQEAKHRGVDVLLVTGDVKDDWWRKEQGEAKGPLPELVHEMRAIARVRLFMLRPESLLVHAGVALGLDISQESIQDAQRVSSQPDITWIIDPRTRKRIGPNISLDIAATTLMINLEELCQNSNKSIFASLMEPVRSLSQSRHKFTSLEAELEAVWSVIDRAISMGIFGNAENARAPVSEHRLRMMLDQLYVSAVEMWLDDLSQEYLLGGFGVIDDGFIYDGPLPPLITSVDTRIGQQHKETYEIEFVAHVTDGREISRLEHAAGNRPDIDPGTTWQRITR